MSNKVTLTFAGDADSLSKESKKAADSVASVGDSADKSSKQLSDASKSGADLGTKMGHLGSAVSGAADAFDAVGGSLQAVVDLEQAGAQRAARLARATNDAESAQQDFNEALQDGKRAQLDMARASIDLEAAQLDAEEATTAYNKAVKEHGANSIEARRAANDLKSAQQDQAEAQADAAEAANDLTRSTIDAKTAQLDLADANREAHPPELQKWADNLALITPLLTAVVGVIGLVTAAQWAWNVAMDANPIGLIIAAVVVLVGIIVLIATKTTWFQDIWRAVWGFLKDVGSWFAGPFADFFVNAWNTITGAFSAAWNWIKDTFTGAALWVHDKIELFMATLRAIPTNLKNAFMNVMSIITSPFRAAFNFVSDAWNNTIGRLHWSVPSWVPLVGGNSISAPKLPHFHTGGIVPGALGAETLAVLQAGERVTPMGMDTSASEMKVFVVLESDGVLKVVRKEVSKRGGDVQRVLGNNRG